MEMSYRGAHFAGGRRDQQSAQRVRIAEWRRPFRSPHQHFDRDPSSKSAFPCPISICKTCELSGHAHGQGELSRMTAIHPAESGDELANSFR
jgi:hypothetical protein